MTTKLTVAGLFAGIGGIEAGLHAAGHRTVLLNEIDEAAGRVLKSRFPAIELHPDVRTLTELPKVDLVSAGFPCQDLSQAGRTAGITGRQSSLVGEVFRLFETAASPPTWLLLENVSFMLHLQRGDAMRFLTSELERMGLRWAYRVVDTRAFGLPHRRQRVILLASRTEDPRAPLFAEEAGIPIEGLPEGRANGFYWTEGSTGLGWAIDAVPPLKGGSAIGIPSAPAIWFPSGLIGTPDIRDAERLQGFEADWTLPGIVEGGRVGPRWKMVGNAVSVPVAAWIGRRLADEPEFRSMASEPLPKSGGWPSAATGGPGKPAVAVSVSHWPTHAARQHLADFLQHDPAPLSERAAQGFLGRARRSSLRFPLGLLDAIEAHIERQTPKPMAIAS